MKLPTLRKHWSVCLIGQASGNASPPLTFIRFRSKRAAERWIAEHTWISTHPDCPPLTIFVPVDLRTIKAGRDT